MQTTSQRCSGRHKLSYPCFQETRKSSIPLTHPLWHSRSQAPCSIANGKRSSLWLVQGVEFTTVTCWSASQLLLPGRDSCTRCALWKVTLAHCIFDCSDTLPLLIMRPSRYVINITIVGSNVALLAEQPRCVKLTVNVRSLRL